MKVQDLINELEKLAPQSIAEEFDNVGLLCGDFNAEVSGILITLDCLEEVVDECIALKFNTIVTFHPIIFKGLKSITGKNYVEKMILKAIKNNINIYAIHTNLDNVNEGVNHKICEVLGLKNQKILIPQENSIYKLITYVPIKYSEKLRNALFEAGAGAIGNYTECSFSFTGHGTFKGNEKTNPFVGNKNERHTENEECLQVIFEKFQQKKILNALFEAHPYEEVAYEILKTENHNQTKGMGRYGNLENEMEEIEFLQFVREKFHAKGIRHSKFLNKKIKSVAVLGGSGSFAIQCAKNVSADILLTADLKYHDFFQAENTILLADIGHYESEQFTKKLLFDYITKKFPNFAIRISSINTNPINYL